MERYTAIKETAQSSILKKIKSHGKESQHNTYKEEAMKFASSYTGSVGLSAWTVIIISLLFSATATSATVIYSNTDQSGYVAAADVDFEMLDYGTSSGGLVKSFTFRYYTETSSPGRVTVRFYRGTDYYTSPGSLLETFTFYGLPGSSYGGSFTKSYTIPTDKQFILESGSFGYSVEFSDSYTYCMLTGGGAGNENYVWMSYYDWIWDEWGWERVYYSSSDYPHAGTYMTISADPPPQPTTVSGYKFNDGNGNGVWDEGEDDIPGWRIYIDENDNGTWDINEPNDITDPNGYYEFTNLSAPNDITVAEVMQEGWTQTLPGGAGTYQLSIVANGQYENKNFGNTDIPVVTDVSISGYVTLSDGTGLEGVTLEARENPFVPTGNTDITDENGYYEIIVPSGWSGSLRISKDGWLFTWSRLYTNITTDQTEDFYAYWPYSGGFGTLNSPYEIATPEDLIAIGLHPEDKDKHFVLTNDIDLSGTTYSDAIINEFFGQFDGAGFSVLNLQSNSGLFGYVKEAVIKNLGVENVDITYATSAGALCNDNYGATIENCFTTGTISGLFGIGGLCGWVHKEYIGDDPPIGPLPTVGTPIIRNCYSTANVTLVRPDNIMPSLSMNAAGGLIGYAQGAVLMNNYALGSVDATGVSFMDEIDIIIDSGGLVGHIKDCNVSNNYSSGHVVDGRAYSNPGGFCGLISGTQTYLIGNFWDIQTSGQSTSAGGTAKTTDLMQQANTFTNVNWDFDTVWKICENTNYPRLMWEADTPGDIACPYGVGIEDFSAVSAQWMLTTLSADISPEGGDGIINIADLARISSAWLTISSEDAFDPACDIAPAQPDNQINTQDITVLAEQWLQKSAHSADIAPNGGDGVVNEFDLAIIAENWLK